MKIYVRGPNERLTKKEIRDIVSFSSQILLGKRLSKYITVYVQNNKLKKYEWGYCGPTDWNYSKHREFEILLNNTASRKNQIITILHEMIHLKQYARNELVCYNTFGKYKWLGKKMYTSPNDYENLPWEIEAEKTEKVLFEMYREHVRIE
jgi:hypothetical protein